MRDFGQPIMPSELETVAAKNPYLKSYVALLKVANGVKDQGDGDGLLGLSLAVYGWMPTILKKSDFAHLGHEWDNLIGEVRGCRNIDDGITLIKRLGRPVISNSWVGSSKVLHFLNPKVFPIWDSLVALASGHSTRGHYETINSYTSYMGRLRGSLDSPCIKQVQTAFRDANHPYIPSSVRSLELILYHDGRIIKAANKRLA